jgi:ankyrin repeat protein
LLDAGAKVSTVSALGTTPLMSAVIACPARLTLRLIESGADLGVHGQDGRTARDIAEECGFGSIVAAIDARLANEAATRTAAEESAARAKAEVNAAIEAAPVLQRDMAVGKPLALKK